MLNKWIVLIGLFCVSSLSFADTAAEVPVQKAIKVKAVQPTATITLAENRTTGYRWYIADYQEEFVDHITATYQSPDRNHSTVGSEGKVVWKVTLDDDVFTAPHLIKLTFKLARSWDLSTAKEKVVYLVT